MKITLSKKTRKHFYVYQNDKKVHTLRKRKPECYTNNNSPVLIKRNSRVREIIYYVCIAAIFIVGCIWARPVAALALLFCTFFLNPFDLTTKTDYYIKRPTGSMEIELDNYKTNAVVVPIKRFQFIHIRFWSLAGTFVMLFIYLIESVVRWQKPIWYVFMAIEILLGIWIMYMATKRYKNAIAQHKIELEENKKILENL